MKLIYSLHIGKNKTRNGEFCGFKSKEDLLDCLLLSVTESKKHFSSCELYCDTEATELLKEDGRLFPFDAVHVVFDELNDWLMPHNWAYAKILAYSLQQTPFIHLDCDAIIWDGIPPQLIDKKFIFYQKEVITGILINYYPPLYNVAKEQNLLPEEITYFPDYAMNAGLFGCPSTEAFPVLQTYCAVAKKYVEKQQEYAKANNLIHDQCIMFEQLFITNIMLDAGLKDGIDFDAFMSKDGNNKFAPQYGFNHFIAGWKRDAEIGLQVRQRLQAKGLERKTKRMRRVAA
jgi:hypothetical protein